MSSISFTENSFCLSFHFRYRCKVSQQKWLQLRGTLLEDQNLKKCNLTLAMSPTCHNNNTSFICWHDFFVLPQDLGLVSAQDELVKRHFDFLTRETFWSFFKLPLKLNTFMHKNGLEQLCNSIDSCKLVVYTLWWGGVYLNRKWKQSYYIICHVFYQKELLHCIKQIGMDSISHEYTNTFTGTFQHCSQLSPDNGTLALRVHGLTSLDTTMFTVHASMWLIFITLRRSIVLMRVQLHLMSVQGPFAAAAGVMLHVQEEQLFSRWFINAGTGMEI